jgi:hypothetical protein
VNRSIVQVENPDNLLHTELLLLHRQNPLLSRARFWPKTNIYRGSKYPGPITLIMNRRRGAQILGREFERGMARKSPEANPALSAHKLQLSSGSFQTMLSRIRWPSRSIHRSVIQQTDTSMTAKRHPPTVVTTTSRIDARGDVTLAP